MSIEPNLTVAGTGERVDATPVPSLRFFNQLSGAAKYLKWNFNFHTAWNLDL
jgi:hypothetical protein